jgi:transposase
MPRPHPETRVGIDLGLKDLATLSDGMKFEAPRYYRATEERLAAAQRARKPSLVRTLSARIKNQRKDHAHKVSNLVCKQYKDIYVGDVSPSEIIQKPRLAKSTLDAGWAILRGMLSYKSIREGGNYYNVDEAYSTQACSTCQVLSGPRGRSGLGIRVWTCGGCGTVQDRDTNAARNVLRWGTPAPVEGVDCKCQSVHSIRPGAKCS